MENLDILGEVNLARRPLPQDATVARLRRRLRDRASPLPG